MDAQHVRGGQGIDRFTSGRCIGQGPVHIGPVGPPHGGRHTHQHGVGQVGSRKIGPRQVGTGQIRALERGLLQIGANQFAVLHDCIGKVGGDGDNAGQARALEIGTGQIGPLGLGIRAFLRLDDAKTQFGIGSGNRAFAQIGLEHVGPRQVGTSQTGPAQVAAAQAGFGQVDILHVGPEKRGIVQLGPVQASADQTGCRKVGVGQIAPAQVKPAQIHPCKNSPRPTGTGLPQPVVAQADSVGFGLTQLFSGRRHRIVHRVNDRTMPIKEPLL